MRNRRLIVLAAALLFVARPAHAETLDLAGILEILEGAIFERILPSGGSVQLGGCTTDVVPGFPTTEIRFHHVGTCKLEGTIRIGILPLSASVRLVVYDTPQLQEVDADFAMRLKLNPIGIDWSLANGRVVFRLTAQSPVTNLALTGQGSRSRPKTGFVAAGRFNLFDPATNAGQALLRNVAGGVRTRQLCTLVGAVPSDPMAGTLSACVTR